jgi:hypothetical protein
MVGLMVIAALAVGSKFVVVFLWWIGGFCVVNDGT